MAPPEVNKDELASSLHAAWKRYVGLLGEPPHGTLPQIKALIELMPTRKSDNADIPGPAKQLEQECWLND